MRLFGRAHRDSPGDFVMGAPEYKLFCVLVFALTVSATHAFVSGGEAMSAVAVDGSDDLIRYEITGGRLLGVVPDPAAASLLISIDAVQDGSITVTIPRSVLDSTAASGGDDDFFVLVGGDESDFDEVAGAADRTLTMQFDIGIEEIEVIGTSARTAPACGPGTELVNGVCREPVRVPTQPPACGTELANGVCLDKPGVPGWLKDTAGWWSQGHVSDGEFFALIQFLIDEGLVKTGDPGGDAVSAKQIISELRQKNAGLENDYNSLLGDYNELVDNYNPPRNNYLQDDYNELVDDYNGLLGDYNELVDDYNGLLGDTQRNYFLEEMSPKTTIMGGEIHWSFYDSKGNAYGWSMPATTYESYVKYDRYPDRLRLDIPSTGQTVTAVDYTRYVSGQNFADTVDDLYRNSYDDYDFLKEVWHVVSNFSTYEYDVGEYPRFALETFSRGSGDCEDTSILLAEMLRSSAHTRHWTVQLVLMDSDNPANPRTFNHVLVYVSNGDWGTYIETTANTKQWGLDAYLGTDIIGWYYDV